MILLVDKIEKSFGARTLFTGATLQINAGERYALVGPNGAGKTTLLKIIMGIDSPDVGSATFAKDCRMSAISSRRPNLPVILPSSRRLWTLQSKSRRWGSAPRSFSSRSLRLESPARFPGHA